ncbi:tyrosine-type recombinase/integrase [Bacillus sp. RIT694]|uniref:tyrosine-type recombinase/integrase n=1 Tax=Bacillus sp. RIT694 TaxID=2666190 RepID=UPI0012ACE7DD|nr:tyrosine-type recombinase/integrase [Bacillus sp. RIT694]MRS25144.1 tyrosine-type recombinase/integrase [Bacillus sp. RIT694]
MLLRFAIKEFIEEKEYANLSHRTIEVYTYTLKEFRNFCSELEIVDLRDVREATVKAYLRYCKKTRKNGVVTCNSKLHHLRIFFNYWQTEEVIEHKDNPVRKLRPAKEDTKIEVFTDYHIQQMLRYYRRMKAREKTYFAYRDHAIIVLLLSTGIRLGELVNIQWKDIDLVNQSVVLFGKARRQQSIPITDKLTKEICEWKIFMEKELDSLPQYLFTTREGKQLSPNAIKLLFKRLDKVMNFRDVRLSCHTFRHTFAHRCITQGMDVFTLQKLLRHSSLRMTERYLSTFGTALKEQNEKYNPLNNIEI